MIPTLDLVLTTYIMQLPVVVWHSYGLSWGIFLCSIGPLLDEERSQALDMQINVI